MNNITQYIYDILDSFKDFKHKPKLSKIETQELLIKWPGDYDAKLYFVSYIEANKNLSKDPLFRFCWLCNFPIEVSFTVEINKKEIKEIQVDLLNEQLGYKAWLSYE